MPAILHYNRGLLIIEILNRLHLVYPRALWRNSRKIASVGRQNPNLGHLFVRLVQLG
jgi:hypothetical protein